MDEFEVKGLTFRIKKMNAIETLAMQSQISFDSMDETVKCYNTILERIEVKVKDQWIQVKQGNQFYPAELENDVQMTEAIIKQMIAYLKSVFQKSDASK